MEELATKVKQQEALLLTQAEEIKQLRQLLQNIEAKERTLQWTDSLLCLGDEDNEEEDASFLTSTQFLTVSGTGNNSKAASPLSRSQHSASEGGMSWLTIPAAMESSAAVVDLMPESTRSRGLSEELLRLAADLSSSSATKSDKLKQTVPLYGETLSGSNSNSTLTSRSHTPHHEKTLPVFSSSPPSKQIANLEVMSTSISTSAVSAKANIVLSEAKLSTVHHRSDNSNDHVKYNQNTVSAAIFGDHKHRKPSNEATSTCVDFDSNELDSHSNQGHKSKNRNISSFTTKEIDGTNPFRGASSTQKNRSGRLVEAHYDMRQRNQEINGSTRPAQQIIKTSSYYAIQANGGGKTSRKSHVNAIESSNNLLVREGSLSVSSKVAATIISTESNESTSIEQSEQVGSDQHQTTTTTAATKGMMRFGLFIQNFPFLEDD